MEPELRALLPWNVTVEKYISKDPWGKPIYGGPVIYRAQIQFRHSEVTNKEGERVYGRTICYLDCIDPIDTLDRITLPVEFGSLQPNIIAVRRVSDERGLHHVVLVVS